MCVIGNQGVLVPPLPGLVVTLSHKWTTAPVCVGG